MKSLLIKAAWRFYHLVHTTGFLADIAYEGGFYARKLTRRYHAWRARRSPVMLEELQPLRKPDPTGLINAGVTNICNAKCTFCAYPKVMAAKTLPTGIMSFEVFKRIADEWKAQGGDTMDLTPVVGDPLVDPGLLQKVEYATRVAGMKHVMLTTNAILLTHNETYKKLIDLGIGSVFISTEGTDRGAYEKVYGVKKYDEMLAGVRALLKYNREKGEPTEVVVRFRNAQKPSQIIRSGDFAENIKPFLSQRVRVNFTVDFDNWGGTISKSDLRGNMRLQEPMQELNLPCQNLFRMSVRHDGSVRLCACRLIKTDMDGLVVGNIKDSSLAEIAAGENAWKVINSFYEGNRPDTCRKCTFYTPVDRKWLRLKNPRES